MRAFEQVLRWIVIIGAYLLPFVVLYVASNMFFPFITGKNFYFRIIVEIVAAAWLALALVLPQYRPRRSWVLAAFAIFVAIMAVADALGANPIKSFWSNFERMDGWITIAHTLMYLVVVVSVLNTEKLWRRLFQLSLAVSVGVGIKGVSQLFGWSAIGQGGVGGLEGRLDATFGNAIYLAVYDLFHVFLAVLLWTQEWHERRPGKRMWIGIIYGFVILFDTFILLFTGTRGTTLGLIGGAILAALLYIIFEPSAKRVRTYAFVSIAVLVVFSVGLWLARGTQQVANIGFLVRLANISASDATVQSRFINIQMAWKGVQERPILGWGQENYALVFDKYFDPRMYSAEPWFDRVHDSIFDWFVAGGILGLLSYLAIFAATLWTLWKSPAFRLYERVIFLGLMAAYFFHNLFVFDNVTSWILFATVLGYIIWRDTEARKSLRVVEGQFMPLAALGFSALGSLIVVGCIFWYANVPPIQQNLTLISALMQMSQGQYDKALASFQSASAIADIGTQETREQLAQAAAQIVGSNASADLKQAYVQTAVNEISKQEKVSPLDARFPLFLGLVFQSAGDYANAEKSFQDALKLSPTKQTIYYQLGQNALSRGDVTGAVDAFKKAYEILPSNLDARLYYAALLIRVSKDADADEVLSAILKTGQAADDRINAAYASRGLYNKIAEVWAAQVAVNPNDPKGYFTLSAAYYAAGEKAKAIQVLQDVAKKIPSVDAQAQSYIQQIQDGTAPKP